LQADAPEGIYNFPSCVFVAKFIGRPPMNLLSLPHGIQVGARSIVVGDASMSVPLVQEGTSSALLGIRPEHVMLSNQANALKGTITYVEYFGSHWIVAVNTKAGMIKALVSKAVRPNEGDSVAVSFNSERVVLFDAATERLLASDTTTAYQRSKAHG
jgi:multiple sugar transport system ATP-binding protein